MEHYSPQQEVNAATTIPLTLGFWSAVVLTCFNILSSLMMIPSWFTNPIHPWTGIAAYASTFDFFQIASMIPGFLVVLPFLPLMASIHYTSPSDHRVFSMIGIAFAAVSVGMLGFQYYSQVTVVNYNLATGNEPGLGLFVLGNPHSFFWPLETLGYGFMSLSTLFAAFAFSRTPLARWIRALFIANGVLGVAGMVAYPFEITTVAVLSGLALWTVIFPVSTVMLAISFRSRLKRLSWTLNQPGT